MIPAVLEIGISIHAPHTRSDLALASQPIDLIFISIHAPHTRSDARQIRDEQSLSNFNPRSSYEERHDDPATGGNVLRDFNPRSSYEERRTRKQYRPFHCNFNPRSSYEERPPVADRCHTGYDSISIHAPHTRSDLMHGSRRRIWIYFNPRSSYEERHMDTLLQLSDALFQSTLLIRGATTICSPDILPLRISIHAPHTRSDLTPEDVKMICRFQSTLLIRGATSPRAAHFRASKFQSTLLIRGATRKVFSSTALASLFQSTLLIRGATRARKSLKYIDSISIHAPHARSDWRLSMQYHCLTISIHAPHARSDFAALARQYHFYISIHAPHARSDISHRDSLFCPMLFQSTLLMRGAT